MIIEFDFQFQNQKPLSKMIIVKSNSWQYQNKCVLKISFHFNLQCPSFAHIFQLHCTSSASSVLYGHVHIRMCNLFSRFSFILHFSASLWSYTERVFGVAAESESISEIDVAKSSESLMVIMAPNWGLNWDLRLVQAHWWYHHIYHLQIRAKGVLHVAK